MRSYTTEPLSAGPHEWFIVANDYAGNERESENQFALNVDNTPPSSFDLLSPKNFWISDNRPVLEWEGSSDNESGIGHYEVWFDGANIENVPPENTQYKVSPTPNGFHQWHVVAVDNVGNKKVSENTFEFELEEYWTAREDINPKNTSPGDVWFAPDNGSVEEGTNYSDEIYVNTGENKLGAYNIIIGYNENILEIDTSKGTNGVEAGEDGFLSVVTQNENGLLINGMEIGGTGPSQKLHLLTVHWIGKNIGSSPLDLSIGELTVVENGSSSIGTPRGIDGERTIE